MSFLCFIFGARVFFAFFFCVFIFGRCVVPFLHLHFGRCVAFLYLHFWSLCGAVSVPLASVCKKSVNVWVKGGKAWES